MKNLRLILPTLLIMAVLPLVNCGGKDEPAPEKTADDTAATADSTTETAQPDPADKKTILRINEKQYTNADLKEFINSRYSETKLIKSNPRLASRIFDTFIEEKMVAFMAAKENIPLEPTEIEKYLRDKHLSLKRLNDPMVAEIVRSQKFLYFKLYKDIDVTDAETRQYYTTNIDHYRRTEEVLLHQIVVKDRTTALDIRRQLLRQPGRFAELAREKSIAADKVKGGEMGFFEKGTLPKDMEQVVFALGTNTISEVFESPYGFHLLKVSRKKRERLLAIKTVEEEIKNKLLSDKLRWAYEDYLVQLRNQLTIKPEHQMLFFTYQPVQGDKENESNQNNPAGTADNS